MRRRICTMEAGDHVYNDENQDSFYGSGEDAEVKEAYMKVNVQ